MKSIDELRAENEALKQEYAQRQQPPTAESDTPKGWERVPSGVGGPTGEKPWYKEGVAGDSLSNVGNVATQAYGTGLEIAAGAAKDLGQTSAATSLLQHKANVYSRMAEFSKDVDPTDENVIPKLIGRLTPYFAAAVATKNPGMVTAGMAGLQAAGSGDPNEPYGWTLAKQLGTTALVGGTNVIGNVVSGAVRTAPETVAAVKQVATSPTNVLGNLSKLAETGANKLKAMVTSNPETKAINVLSGTLGGGINNLLDYQDENRAPGPSTDPYTR